MIPFNETARQEDRMISFKKNQANNSITASKTIEPNESETIQQITNNKIKQIAIKIVDVSKTIEQYTSKKNETGAAKHFPDFIDNLLSWSRLMTTTLGESLRTDTVNHTYPTSQPTVVHIKQANFLEYNDQNHFPIWSFNSGIDVL